MPGVPETTTLALVLLPVVLLLGIAAYARLVQINVEECRLVLAMKRLRQGYLDLEPGLARYRTTSQHDDQTLRPLDALRPRFPTPPDR